LWFEIRVNVAISFGGTTTSLYWEPPKGGEFMAIANSGTIRKIQESGKTCNVHSATKVFPTIASLF
jgi:hypothetical protein